MSKSICQFISAKNEESNIKAVRFVYETECLSLSQPFVHPIYVIHIVTQGSATLRINDNKYFLKRGDVFFAFPAYPHYIDANEDFEYIYISFMGGGATSLLSKCKITPNSPYYDNLSFLCTMFENAIRRINSSNANMLTESVLYYALSYFDNNASNSEIENQVNTDGLFKAIVNYVDRHYRENDMSLSRLANVFSYTEKYLSSLFKKNMQIGFVSYLNNLRIQYANELIEKRELNISEIADACGYSDYSYFSKVYKKSTGKTPTESIEWIAKRK